MNHRLARRSTLGIVLAAACLALPDAGRACRYCRQGEDPEAYRFMNECKLGGGFPVDAGMGQYAGDPGAGPVVAKVANPPATPAAAAGSPAINAVAAAAPPAASQARVAVPASPAGVSATAATASPEGWLSSATARGADLGLLGLLGLGAWFGWRTRQGRPRQTLA